MPSTAACKLIFLSSHNGDFGSLSEHSNSSASCQGRIVAFDGRPFDDGVAATPRHQTQAKVLSAQANWETGDTRLPTHFACHMFSELDWYNGAHDEVDGS